MPSYTDLISRLGYSDEIVAISRGDVELPTYSFDAPSHPMWSFFPPALLPLWSRGEGPCYIGIVKHWFGQDDGTFVEYDIEGDGICEIAKNFEQFKAWLVFDFLWTGRDTDEVGRFAESIGFCAADEVEASFESIKKIPDLVELEVFATDPPASIFSEWGCARPDWATDGADADTIRGQIADGDLVNAWYNLNSSRLDEEDTRDLLLALAPHVTEDRTLFDELVEYWSKWAAVIEWWK